MKRICIYCSSANDIDKKYFAVAHELGEKLAQNNMSVVYGGSNLGLMGEVANTAHNSGAKVLGIVPKKLYTCGIEFPEYIELIITEDMRERKKKMEDNSDAFIAMPGGFGTLEEVSEIIVGKQLGYHYKPIVFLNIDGYYDKLFEFFDKFFSEKFANEVSRDIYYNACTVDEAINYISNYKIIEDKDKWLEKFNFVR